MSSKGKVKLTAHRINKAIEQTLFKKKQYEDLEQTNDVKNNITILEKALELLYKAKNKEESEIEIEYTPLLHYEIVQAKKGFYKEDDDAHICATHCFNPKKTYEEWRDLKDPTLKTNIAAFIIANSFPEVKQSSEEKEAFQLLQGLV